MSFQLKCLVVDMLKYTPLLYKVTRLGCWDGRERQHCWCTGVFYAPNISCNTSSVQQEMRDSCIDSMYVKLIRKIDLISWEVPKSGGGSTLQACLWQHYVQVQQRNRYLKNNKHKNRMKYLEAGLSTSRGCRSLSEMFKCRLPSPRCPKPETTTPGRSAKRVRSSSTTWYMSFIGTDKSYLYVVPTNILPIITVTVEARSVLPHKRGRSQAWYSSHYMPFVGHKLSISHCYWSQ